MLICGKCNTEVKKSVLTLVRNQSYEVTMKCHGETLVKNFNPGELMETERTSVTIFAPVVHVEQKPKKVKK